jgi:hypothetical protein
MVPAGFRPRADSKIGKFQFASRRQLTDSIARRRRLWEAVGGQALLIRMLAGEQSAKWGVYFGNRGRQSREPIMKTKATQGGKSHA